MELSARKEANTLEKIWEPLFDKDGRLTVRLGRFLRELAVYIVHLASSGLLVGCD